MRRYGFLAIFLFFGLTTFSQGIKKSSGLIAGNVLDSVSQRAIAGASVQLALIGSDKTVTKSTDKNGEFSFIDLSFG